MQTAKRPESIKYSFDFDDVEAGDILITPVAKYLVTEKEHISFDVWGRRWGYDAPGS